MNVTHNLSTCKYESIKIISFIDILNIDIASGLLWCDQIRTTVGRVDILFYTAPSSDLWFWYYSAKRCKFQKENYCCNKIHFGQFQTRGAFIFLAALYFTEESISSFNILFTVFNVRTLLELLSSDSPLYSSLCINENDNNQKQISILGTLGLRETKAEVTKAIHYEKRMRTNRTTKFNFNRE